MSAPIVQQTDCCSSCESPLVENVPGPQGPAGANGTNGTNGSNAFTTTTAQFTQPAVSSSVSVSVVDSTWAAVGQIVYIATGGYYQVSAVPTSVSLTLTNLGYTGNAAPTTVITSAQKVSPGGTKGADGSTPSDVLLKANNLSDLTNATTARTNLSLGSLATLSAVNNGNWSGTALAINNGGTGATIAATALSNLGGQPVDALLTSLAAQGASANEMYYTTAANTIAVIASTSFGRSALTDTDAPSMRARIGKILPRYGILAMATGINLNSAGSDNAISVEGATYRIDKVMIVNGSVSLTTATAGVFTAAGGLGTVVSPDQSLAALTASTKYKDLTLDAGIGTDVLTASTLYIRNGTAQGSAATADFFILGWRLD